MSRSWSWPAVPVLCAAVLCASGCDEALTSAIPTSPSPTVATPAPTETPAPGPSTSGSSGGDPTATFTIVRRTVLADCVSCHSDAGARFNGSLSLQTNAYANLVNAASSGKAGATRVIPGNPGGSYLVQKLEGAAGIAGSRMPLGGPFLNVADLATLRRWITAGALND